MLDNPEPIKTERVDNSDGSYCIKNIFDDNTSEIITYNEQNLIISVLTYSDSNFENFVMSIICEYDKNNKLISRRQFVDKNFTDPIISEHIKYKLLGYYVSKIMDYKQNCSSERIYDKNNNIKQELVIDYNVNRSAKRIYNIENKLIKELVYNDINFKKLSKIITNKYCKNSYIIKKSKYLQNDWKHTTIKEFNENNILLSEYFQDKLTGQHFTQYKYTDGKLSEEKVTYYKHKKISGIYKTTYKYENNKLAEVITQDVKKRITSFRTFEYLNNGNILQKYKFPLKNESEIFLCDENEKPIEKKYYNDVNFEKLRVYVNTTYEASGKEIHKAVYTNTDKTIKSVISNTLRINGNNETIDYCYSSTDFTELFATIRRNNLKGTFTREVILEQPSCNFFTPYGNFDEYKITNIYWQSYKEKSHIQEGSISQTIYYSDNNFHNSCCTSYRKFAKNETDTIFLNIYKNTSSNYLYEFEKYDGNMQLVIQKQYKYLGILAKLRFWLSR